MNCVIGIDVGGNKKGFAIAAMTIETLEWIFMEGASDVDAVLHKLRRSDLGLKVIAIDCPPTAQINGPKTRSAERELHKLGYRVQWTRRQNLESQEWMLNGQALWDSLRREFSNVELIETFPTAAFDHVSDYNIRPLARPARVSHINSHHHDLMDAALCAIVAHKYTKGSVQVVGNASSGEEDELGPIYY